MPSITCYWSNVSQPSRAMKAFLDDSGIPYVDHPVDMLKGENYTDPEVTKYRGEQNLWVEGSVCLVL